MKFSAAATVLSLAATAAATPKCNCCGALAKVPELDGKVLAKDTEEYNARLETYYSANAALPAWCMVMPTSTEDVQKIAKVFSENECTFGMRSGAHSAWAGSNGVKEGVTVDFSYINGTEYDAENKVAKIGPGSNWGEAFTVLDEFGVAAVGGRASVVGVGGFTTGSGYSFHSNRRGFACDNVANFEVVLADGSVVNANADEHTDLWKALKGGSGNLGFVTRIDTRIVESTQMWGGFVSYDLSNRDKVFNAYLNFCEHMDKDLASQNIVALYYDSTGYSLRSILTNVDAIPTPPAFDEYVKIANTSSTLRIGSVAELVPEFTGPTPLGLYANWMTGTSANDFRMMEFIDIKHKEYTQKMVEAAPDSDFNVLVQFQPVTQSIVNHAAENGGNVLGLESVVADGPVLMWLIATTVDTPENQEKITPLQVQFRDEINAFAKENDLYSSWEFLNYAYADQDPISTYGDENIQLLKQAAQTYDPEGMFQKLRTTGFHLPA